MKIWINFILLASIVKPKSAGSSNSKDYEQQAEDLDLISDQEWEKNGTWAIDFTVGSADCSHLPGGLRRITQGVDILRLDLKPLDYMAPDGYALPVLELTCSHGRVWNNPHNSETYQWPDQVSNMHHISAGELTAKSWVYKSSYDVKEEMSIHAKVSVGWGPFTATLSSTYKKMSETIRERDLKVTEVSAFTSAIYVGFYRTRQYLSLSKHAQKFLDMLPDSILQDRAGYAHFIELFGTHYFHDANLGGILNSVVTTKVDAITKSTGSEISAEAKLAFQEAISASLSTGFAYSKEDMNSKISSQTKTELRFYGGNLNLLEKDGIKKWQPTVCETPWVYHASFEPIYKLVEDEKKREQVKIAIESHLNSGFLEHLIDTFNKVVMVYQKLEINTNALEKIKIDLDKEASEEFPLSTKLLALEKRLQKLVNPPEWWEDVQMCFQVDYEKDRKSYSKTLCAKTDSFTAPFFDQIQTQDIKSGMNWTIVSKGPHENYFNDVKLCFRWFSIDERLFSACYGQVNNTSANEGEVCAPLNENTPTFSSSNVKGTNCGMSWKLEVPPETDHPWLLTTKLCFIFSTPKVQHPRSRQICAYANYWTDFYSKLVYYYLPEGYKDEDYCFKFSWSLTAYYV